MPVQCLQSLPWEALSPGNDVLRLTAFPDYARLFPSTHTRRGQIPITAIFPVPAGVQVLLQAVRHFAEPISSPRLFASTRFTFERIAPAAAHCAITLPDQHRYRLADLSQSWQSRVTCTPAPHLGDRYDTRFIQDQAFAPLPKT